MMTNRQMLALILRRQAVMERLLLLVLREAKEIELGQEDIDAAVSALGTVANDLKEMSTTTNARITDVDTEVQALKAQLASMGQPVDTTALDAAVQGLKDAHDQLATSVQALADDANVPPAGSGDDGQVGGDGTGSSGTEPGTPADDGTATTESPVTPAGSDGDANGDVTVHDLS